MSFFSDVERDLVVVGRTEVADGVVAIDLAAPNGRDLPAWTPGSHIDVRVSPDLERQYSLCSDPAARGQWRIAVLREADGRGGSLALCDTVREGQRLRIRGPRNHFAFDPPAGTGVVFVAGGIGITPIRAMIAEAERRGVHWSLHYAGRSHATMAFADELVAAHGERIVLYPADEGRRLPLAGILQAARADEAQVFACGPLRMMEDIETATLDWPDGVANVEHFVAREFGPPVWQEPFEVELSLSGRVVTVPLERSILDVLDDEGVIVASSCREGTCGTCETPVLEGDIEHRDSVLTPAEQAESLTMMVCVSRAACPRIVLDL